MVLGVPVRGKNLIGWNLFASDVPLEPRAKLGERRTNEIRPGRNTWFIFDRFLARL